jgi:hypothetical protein
VESVADQQAAAPAAPLPEVDMLVQHAKEELERAGMFDKDADYGGAIAEYVMDLMEVFASQEHSGGTAMLTLEVFNQLARFSTLAPLTTDPAEWMDVSAASGGEGVWQNRRKPSVFSNDGGKTAYDLDTDRGPVELISK